ncbi:MAG: methyltransferase domain-containing protein [Runella sp.]
MTTPLSQEYWDQRYLTGQTGWDIGYAAPALVEYFDTLSNTELRILIPGAGNAYEAAYLLDKGFGDVTVVDISEIVCQKLTEKYAPKGLKVVCQDFFEHQGCYDLIVEQTFFCALLPTLRVAYIQKMRELLDDEGVLAGLLFNRAFEGGPPFGGHEAEYRALFEAQQFDLQINLEPRSIPPRQGSELFFISSKKKNTAQMSRVFLS